MPQRKRSNACAGATELEPDSALGHWLLGNALIESGHAEQALLHYQKTLALKPDFAMAHSNLACALRDLGRLEAAAMSFQQAVQLMPDQGEVHNNLSIVLRLLHRYEEATESASRAHELNATSAAPLISLARLKADRGDFGAAEELLGRALTLDPQSAEACSAVASLRNMTTRDAKWFAHAKGLAALDLPTRQQAHLHYALGKYCDDTGEFAQAFSHYRRANDLKKSHSPGYDSEQLHDFVTRLIQSATGEWVNRQRDSATSAQPIFIVGMPRSGTSLAEQILASHPSIKGAGELAYWGRALAEWSADSISGREDERLGAHAAQYLRLIGTHAARGATSSTRCRPIS